MMNASVRILLGCLFLLNLSAQQLDTAVLFWHEHPASNNQGGIQEKSTLKEIKYGQLPCYGDKGGLVVKIYNREIIGEGVVRGYEAPYAFTWFTPHGDTTIHCCEESGVYEGAFFDTLGNEFFYQNNIVDRSVIDRTDSTLHGKTVVWIDSFILGNVPAGFFEYSFIDKNNFYGSGAFQISQPDSISVEEAIILPPSCEGVGDGLIQPLPQGGNQNYPYAWWESPDGSGTDQFRLHPLYWDIHSPTQDSLSPGLYEVTIYDVQGCSGTGSFRVPEPEPVVIDSLAVVDASCISLDDGAIRLSAKGGREPYIFLWETLEGPEIIPVGNTQNSLRPGRYSVTVYGDGDCEGEHREIAIETRPMYAGVARDTAICSNEPLNLYDLLSDNDPGGYFAASYQSPIASQPDWSISPEGKHRYYYAIDENELCEGDTSFFYLTVSHHKEAGTGGDFFRCGTQHEDLFTLLTGADPGGYWINRDGEVMEDPFLGQEDLQPGSNDFVYHVEGDSLCPSSSSSVTIRLDSTKPEIECPDDFLARMNAVSAAYLVEGNKLDPLVFDDCAYALSNSWNQESTLDGASIPENMSIVWKATNEAGLSVSCQFSLAFEFFIPNLITPDGDGYNDTWDFNLSDAYPDAVLTITDRWGKTVFVSEPGYPVKWAGYNQSGNPVPNGNYYFNIQGADELVASGFITVLR